MKKNFIKNALLMALGVTLPFTSCNMNSLSESDKNSSSYNNKITTATLQPDVNELVCNVHYFMIGERSETVFAVRLSGDDISKGIIPELYNSDGTKICSLTDDGTGADEVENDGIYTCSADVASEDGKPQSYYVMIGDTKTNQIEMTYFDEITSEDCEHLEEVQKMFSEAVKDYTKDGYTTDKKSAVEAAEKIAKQLYESGDAIEYKCDPDAGSVYVKLNSGLSYIYSTLEEGYD
ncbi:MAG: hypothetical protein Q4F95_00515 [Oscillospiraceae bacterium]|nr:hypothetical protein [Oscillospiraceae bacterium]